MRQRYNGFTKFMKRIEGETNNDYFSETEEIGSELYQRYEWILKLLRSEISWCTYMDRIDEFSLTQRSAWASLRGRIGLDFPFDTVGVYVTDRSFYRKAIEYLREHQESEQQGRVSSGTRRPVSLGNTDDLYIGLVSSRSGAYRASGSSS